MSVSKVLSRIPGSVSVHCRTPLLLSPARYYHSSILSNYLQFLCDSPNKLAKRKVSLLHLSALHASTSPRFGFSSFSSPPPTAENNDSYSKRELSMDDMLKLVAEKEELLKMKCREIEKLQPELEDVKKSERSYAMAARNFGISWFAAVVSS